MTTSPLPQWTVLPLPIVDSQLVTSPTSSSFSQPNTEIDELANDEDLFPSPSPQYGQAKPLKRRRSSKKQVKMGTRTSLFFDYKQPVATISTGMCPISIVLLYDIYRYLSLDKSKPSNLQVEQISPDSEVAAASIEDQSVQATHSTSSAHLKFTSHGAFRKSHLSWMTSTLAMNEQILFNLLKRRTGKSPSARARAPSTVSAPTVQQDMPIARDIQALTTSEQLILEDLGVMMVDAPGSESEERREEGDGPAKDAMEVDIPSKQNLNSTANSILGAFAAASIKELAASAKSSQPPLKLPNSITLTPPNITPSTATPIPGSAAPNSPNASTTPSDVPGPVSLSFPIPIPTASTSNPEPPSTSPTSPATRTQALPSPTDIRSEACAAGLFVPSSRKRPLQDSHRSNDAADGPSSPKRPKYGTKCHSSSGESCVQARARTTWFNEQLTDGWKKSIRELEEALVNLKASVGKPEHEEASKRYHHAFEDAKNVIGIIDDSKSMMTLYIIQVSNLPFSLEERRDADWDVCFPLDLRYLQGHETVLRAQRL